MGFHLAYISGDNIIILNENCSEFQILPIESIDDEKLYSINCSQFSGKVFIYSSIKFQIALSFSNHVDIYAPKLNVETGQSESPFDIAWALETRFATCQDRSGPGVRSILAWSDTFSDNLCVPCDSGLLIGLSSGQLCIWRSNRKEEEEDRVIFTTGSDRLESGAIQKTCSNQPWTVSWSTDLKENLSHLSFSPDGLYFSSLSSKSSTTSHESVLRVWTRRSHVLRDDGSSEQWECTILTHPCSILCPPQWRQPSRFLPSEWLPNALITSAEDNVFRVWIESSNAKRSFTPPNRQLREDIENESVSIALTLASPRANDRDQTSITTSNNDHQVVDGQLELSVNSSTRRHPILTRLLQNWLVNPLSDANLSCPSPSSSSTESWSALPASSSDNRASSRPPPSDSPRFSLAASLSLTDCPALANVDKSLNKFARHQFTLQWLNNKQYHFDLEVERLLANCISRLVMSSSSDNESQANLMSQELALIDQTFVRLISQWQHDPDIVFTVNPLDGSLILWSIDNLDLAVPSPGGQLLPCFGLPNDIHLSPSTRRQQEQQQQQKRNIKSSSNPSSFTRLTQVLTRLFARLPKALPAKLAQSASANRCPLVPSGPRRSQAALLATFCKAWLLRSSSTSDRSTLLDRRKILSLLTQIQITSLSFDPVASVIQPCHFLSLTTHHTSGTLRSWRLEVSEASHFQRITSVTDQSTVTGQQFGSDSNTPLLVSHPLLPLLLTTSTTLSSNDGSPNCQLALWCVGSVGPFAFNSIRQGHRRWLPINSGDHSALDLLARAGRKQQCADLAWFPTWFNCRRRSEQPDSGFITSLFAATDAIDGHIKLYAAVVGGDGDRDADNELPSNLRPSHDGSLIELDCDFEQECPVLPGSDKNQQPTVLLLHVFPSQLLLGGGGGTSQPPDDDNDLQADSSQIKVVDDESRPFRFFLLQLTKWGSADRSSSSRCQVEMWQLDVALANDSTDSKAENGGLILVNCVKVCSHNLVTEEAGVDLDIDLARVSMEQFNQMAACSFNSSSPPPYLLVTQSSRRDDGCIRFWRCDAVSSDSIYSTASFVWSEWQMPLTDSSAMSSAIKVLAPSQVADVTTNASDRIVALSAVYPGRLAVVYTQKSRLLLAVFECESTGACEWVLEDTIDLTVELAEARITVVESALPDDVQLDWVSCYDGTFLLSVLLRWPHNNLLLVYAPHCLNVASSSPHLQDSSKTSSEFDRRRLTLMTSLGEVYTGWRRLTCLKGLGTSFTADSSNDIQIAWLSGGLLVVQGSAHNTSSSHLSVYSQWPSIKCDSNDVVAVNGGQGRQTKVKGADDELISGPSSMTIARLTQAYSSHLLSSSRSQTDLAKINQSIDSGKIKGQVGDHLSREFNSANTTSELGLFESAQVINPILPQFHPRQLLEWLNLGKLRRVKAILAHLTRCLVTVSSGYYPPANRLTNQLGHKSRGGRKRREEAMSEDDEEEVEQDSLRRHRVRSSSNADRQSSSSLPIEPIPPLPLYLLTSVDDNQNSNEKPPTGDSDDQDENDSDLLTDEDLTTDSDDDGEERMPPTKSARDRPSKKGRERIGMWSVTDTSVESLTRFTSEDARLLAEFLATRQLPGLSSLDQMYLLGIADLMANVSSDVTSFLDQSTPAHAYRKTAAKAKAGGGSSSQPTHQGLDECGLRFMLTVQLYSYLGRTLPPFRRAQLLSTGLTSSSLIWAFHSEAEEELLTQLPSFKSTSSADLTWVEFRRYGCGWWIRSTALLRTCIEKICRSTYQATKDPMEVAIFYLAMNKAKVLAGLCKIGNSKQLESFFRSDFQQPGSASCRQAKLNAFRLLSQHKYHQAAGLFILAGCLQDAVRVCLDKLHDLQLAMVVVRLSTSSSPGHDESVVSPVLSQLLHQHVIVDSDPFLRSMAYWILGDHLTALYTLLDGTTDTKQSPTSQQSVSSINGQSDPPLTVSPHAQRPSLLSQHLSLSTSGPVESKTTASKSSVFPNVFKFYTYLRQHPLIGRRLRHQTSHAEITSPPTPIVSLERRLYFRTAHHYSSLGCPALALEVLTRLGCYHPDGGRHHRRVDDVKDDEDEIESQSTFDSWRSMESENSDRTVTSINNATIEPQQGVDLIANQLRFIACSKILSEELSTLASGTQIEGQELRHHIWRWLENELALVGKLVTGRPGTSLFNKATIDGREEDDQERKAGGSPLTSQVDLSRRRHWLQSHAPFLSSLVNYCNIYGLTGSGLPVVRVELLLLLAELSDHHGVGDDRKSLVHKLPLLRSLASSPSLFLPFVSPVDQIQIMIRQIVACLESLPPPYLLSEVIRLDEKQSVDSPSSSNNRRRSVVLLRNQCSALALCVHQCLTQDNHQQDNDTTTKDSTSQPSLASVKSATDPSKWPGSPIPPSIDSRFLLGLLGQALATTFVGLVVYALHVRDASILYRLVGSQYSKLDAFGWSVVFGGGAGKQRPTQASPQPPSRPPPPSRPSRSPAAASRSTLAPPSTPQGRLSPNFKATSKPPQRPTNPTPGSGVSDDHASSFIPPHCSMLGWLLEKPKRPPNSTNPIFDLYDSDDDSDTPADTRDNIYDSYDQALAKSRRRLKHALAKTTHSSVRQQKMTTRPTVTISKLNRNRFAATSHSVLTASMSVSDHLAVAGNEEESSSLGEEMDEHEETADRQPTSLIGRRCLNPDLGFDWLKTLMTDQSIASSDLDNDEDDFGDDFYYNDYSDDNEVSPRQLAYLEAERQWSDGDSYAWRLIRLGVVQLVRRELQALGKALNFGPDDPVVFAPCLVRLNHLTDQWLAGYRLGLTTSFLNSNNDNSCSMPPRNFLPNIQPLLPSATPDQTDSGNGAARSMQRLQHLTDVRNSPFQTYNPFSLPVKRLWCSLVRQPVIDDLFLRHIYRQPVKVDATVEISLQTISWLTGTTNNKPSVPSYPTTSSADMSPKLSLGHARSRQKDDLLQQHGPTRSASLDRKTRSSPSTRKKSMEVSRQGRDLQTQSHVESSSSQSSILFDSAIRLIHKEQEPLLAMCVSQADNGLMVVATSKELVELNVANIQKLPVWYSDEVEYDLELMRKPQVPRSMGDLMRADDFIIHTSDLYPQSSTSSSSSTGTSAVDANESPSISSSQKGSSSLATSPPNSSRVSRQLRALHHHHKLGDLVPSLSPNALERSRRLVSTVLKRPVPAVYGLASHPYYPYYLAGTGTGSLHLYEWLSEVEVVRGLSNTLVLTPAGASGDAPAGSRGAMVTSLAFDPTGCRFGCGDSSGYFGLWNLHKVVPGKSPYFRCHCHAKGLSDFCFVGSSTLVATVGNGGGGSSQSDRHVVGGLGTSSSMMISPSSGEGSVSSSDPAGANIALWDVLMAPGRNGVARITDPSLDVACTSVAYLSPTTNSIGWQTTATPSRHSTGTCWFGSGGRDRTIVVGNRRGQVAFVDLRRPNKALYCFTAHDPKASIRCIRVDPVCDCLATAGSDGSVKLWRLSSQELIGSFSSDFHQGQRGTTAAAALFRGNQSAAMIAALQPGVSKIQLLDPMSGAAILVGSGQKDPMGEPINHRLGLASNSPTCRFLSCGADGGLRLRNVVIRPRPFQVY